MKWVVDIYKKLPINRNKVVFVSHSGKQIDCNPYAISSQLVLSEDIEIIWLVKKELVKIFKKNPKYNKYKLIDYDSKLALYHVSTCSAFINNQLMIKFYEDGIRRREGQLFINTWHGSFGLKKIPLRDNLNIVKNSSEEFNYFLSNSDFETQVYKNSFSKNIQVLKVGHPRNDVLIQNNAIKKDVYAELNIPLDKKIALWAPTARDINFEEAFNLDVEKIVNSLQIRFGGEWILLYRLHRNNSDIFHKIELKNNLAINVSEYKNLNSLILISDVLISDYSSIICDYILTKKVAFIYAPDYINYKIFNPLYYNLEELPFGVAKNNEELSFNIKNYNSQTYIAGINKWLLDVKCTETGRASKIISTIILEHLKYTYDTLRTYTNVFTPDIARCLGHQKLYFTFRNIGDQLILQRAVNIYHRRSEDKKILIGTMLPELWENNKNVDIVILKEKKLHCYSKDNFDFIKNCNIKPIFLTQEKFNKREDNKYIRTFGQYHIVGSIASKMGIKGSIRVDLDFYLDKKEREFGKFTPNQIVIVAGGLQRYKTYPQEKLQQVINRLKNYFEFIQVGVTSDPLLDNVLDMRGKLSLRQVAAVIANSKAFVGGIGGLTHLANAVRCPSVVLYSSAEPDYIVNYNSNINIHPNKNACRLCQEGKHCPWTSPCLTNQKNKQYSCIDDIRVEDIVNGIMSIAKRKKRFIPTIIDIEPNEVKGVEEYLKTGFNFIADSKGKNSILSQKSYFLPTGKKVDQYLVANIPVASRIESLTNIKYRFLKFSINRPRKEIKTMMHISNTELPQVSAGNKDWIRGVENYAHLLIDVLPKLDDQSTNILSLVLKRKRIAYLQRKDTFLATEFERQTISVIKEFYDISDISVTELFLEGERKNIYQYGKFFIPYKVHGLFSIYHNCFVNDNIKNKIENKDIIDIGAGVGDTALFFSDITNSKIWALEPAEKIFEVLKRTISLNKKDNIIPINYGLWESEQIRYIKNELSTLNAIQNSNKNAISKKFITLDTFVKDKKIIPGLIKIYTNWGEYNILKGGVATINEFRPALIVNLSASGVEMFKIFNFIITNFKFYKLSIKKTYELHASNGLFLVCEPMEDIKYE